MPAMGQHPSMSGNIQQDMIPRLSHGMPAKGSTHQCLETVQRETKLSTSGSSYLLLVTQVFCSQVRGSYHII